MSVNDKDCALWTVQVLQDDLDRRLESGGSPSSRIRLPRNLGRHGQGLQAEFEPELVGIVMEAIERAVQVVDGEQQRHDRTRDRGRSHRLRHDAQTVGSEARIERGRRGPRRNGEVIHASLPPNSDRVGFFACSKNASCEPLSLAAQYEEQLP
jgi:hypothetical protein